MSTLCLRRDMRIETKGPNAGKYVSKKGRPTKVPERWFSFLKRPDHTKFLGRKWCHHIGFVPVTDQDKWALEAIDEDVVTVLDQFYPEPTFKKIPLKDCVGQSFELVGPKIQRDPHGFGRHCLVPHRGSGIRITDLTSLDLNVVREYVSSHDNLEGIVLHFPDVGIQGRCFKVHRYHLGLRWIG